MTDWRRILRFGVAGGGNTVLTFAVYALLVRVGVAYPVANAAGWVTGLICGYLLGKLFVFRDRRVAVHRSSAQFLAFAGVYVASFLLSTAMLAALVESGLSSPVIAQVFVIPLVATFNFVASRRVVFNGDASR